MKYIRLFEELEEIKGIWFVINFSDEDSTERSINKIESILNVNVIKGIDLKTIKEKFNQSYLCVSVGIRRPELGFMPLININDMNSKSKYGFLWFKNHKKYTFGGYINCTKEEVDNYIEIFDSINKFNV